MPIISNTPIPSYETDSVGSITVSNLPPSEIILLMINVITAPLNVQTHQIRLSGGQTWNFASAVTAYFQIGDVQTLNGKILRIADAVTKVVAAGATNTSYALVNPIQCDIQYLFKVQSSGAIISNDQITGAFPSMSLEVFFTTYTFN